MHTLQPNLRIRATVATLASAMLMAGLAGAAPALAQTTPPIQVTVQNSAYVQSGRPAGMDDGSGDCNTLDDSQVVSRFNISAQIKNNSDTPMSNWGAQVVTNKGKDALVCLIQEAGAIEPGQTVNVTFAAFMERGETARRLIIGDDAVGQSAPVNFNASGRPTGAGRPVPTPRPTATPRAAAGGPIVVTLQNTGYEEWGRPAGMDDPQAGCSAFDNSRPVSKYNLSLQIKNNSTKDMTDWGLGLAKRDGQPAFLCFYTQDGQPSATLPVIPAGGAVNVTFAAFMEPGEKAGRMFIADTSVGRSREIRLP